MFINSNATLAALSADTKQAIDHVLQTAYTTVCGLLRGSGVEVCDPGTFILPLGTYSDEIPEAFCWRSDRGDLK
jgi:hypothetical protein